jgi:hypothetical protein
MEVIGFGGFGRPVNGTAKISVGVKKSEKTSAAVLAGLAALKR